MADSDNGLKSAKADDQQLLSISVYALIKLKQVDAWVEKGIIEPCFSCIDSLILEVLKTKKDSSFRQVLKFCGLDDQYDMKDVGDWFGEIGRYCHS